MRNALRKLALPTTIAIFCALIGLGTYVASKNLKTIQQFAAQRMDASDVRSHIVAVELDLKDIETGQRGYLLTGDGSYLAPYTDAIQKLPADISALRAQLADKPPAERADETELEAIAASKIAEVNDTIRLRQKGYRHRAFVVVNSNHGKELMDRAQVLLDRMSAVEARNVTQYEHALTDSVTTAREQSVLASLILLVLTVMALIALNQQRKRLELVSAGQTLELRAARRRIEQLTSTMSGTLRGATTQMSSDAESLLHVHGGFLPRQGQERAESIHEASCYINRVLDNLLSEPSSSSAADDAGDQTGRPYPVQLAAAAEGPRSRTA